MTDLLVRLDGARHLVDEVVLHQRRIETRRGLDVLLKRWSRSTRQHAHHFRANAPSFLVLSTDEFRGIFLGEDSTQSRRNIYLFEPRGGLLEPTTPRSKGGIRLRVSSTARGRLAESEQRRDSRPSPFVDHFPTVLFFDKNSHPRVIAGLKNEFDGVRNMLYGRTIARRSRIHQTSGLREQEKSPDLLTRHPCLWRRF